MHYPWIRSVRPNRQLPGIAPEILHWSFDRPNGNIIEGDTGPRSVNFNGTWVNVSGNNWAVNLTNTTGATTELPVLYQNNVVTVKFRFRPWTYESGGTSRFLFRSGASPNNATSFSIFNNFNSLYFNVTNAGTGQTRLNNVHTSHPVGSWYDVVAVFTTWAGSFGGSVPGSYNYPRIWINGVTPTFTVEGGGGNYHEWFNHRVATLGNGGIGSTSTDGFNCDLEYFKIFYGYQSYPYLASTLW